MDEHQHRYRRHIQLPNASLQEVTASGNRAAVMTGTPANRWCDLHWKPDLVAS